MKEAEENKEQAGNSWKQIEGYAREEAEPPAFVRARDAAFDQVPLPEDLDRRMSLAMQAAGKDFAPVAKADANANESLAVPAANRANGYWKWIGAAAFVMCAGVGVWIASSGAGSAPQLAAEFVGASGSYQIDPPANAAAGTILATGSKLELAERARLDLRYAPGLVLSLRGPARFAIEADGVLLMAGRLHLLADRAAVAAVPMDGATAQFDQAHSTLRLRTAAASYHLLGTYLQLDVQSNRQVLSVVEGAVGVALNDSTAQVSAGRVYQLGDAAAKPMESELAPDARARLLGERAQLLALALPGEASPAPESADREAEAVSSEGARAGEPVTDAPVSTSDLGPLMEFELRDGRRIQGVLIRRAAGGTVIQPAKGPPVPVQDSDIISFRAL